MSNNQTTIDRSRRHNQAETQRQVTHLPGQTVGHFETTKWFKVYSVAAGVMTCYAASYSVAGGWVTSGSANILVYPHPSIGADGIHHYPVNSYISASKVNNLLVADYTFPCYFKKYEDVLL